MRPPTFDEASTAVITQIQLIDTTVSAGDEVAEISGRPIVVLPGEIPLLRNLWLGDSGADVASLEAGLAVAGVLASDQQDGVITEADLSATSVLLGGLPASDQSVTVALELLRTQRRDMVAVISDIDQQIVQAESPASAADIERAEAQIELLKVSQDRTSTAALEQQATLAAEISQLASDIEALALEAARLQEAIDASTDPTERTVLEADLTTTQGELDAARAEHDDRAAELALVEREALAQAEIDRLDLDDAQHRLDLLTDPPRATELRRQRDTEASGLGDLDRQIQEHEALQAGFVPASQIVVVEQLPAKIVRYEHEVGDPFTGGPLLELQSSQPSLVVTLDASSANYIVTGSLAEILDDALAPTTATALVSTIRRGADTVEVVMTINNPDEVDLPGNVAVRFDLRESSDTALALPSAALSHDANGRTFVTILKDGNETRVYVSPGVVTSEGLIAVEIVEGILAAGDEVVIGIARPDS